MHFTITKSYHRHFTVTSSFWLRPSSFSLSFFYIEEEPPPPRSTVWGAYMSAISCGTVPSSICLQSHICTHFTHSRLVGRSMVVGHILTVHTCSLICTNHIDMAAHTPAFILLSWVPLIYMWSAAQLGIVMYHTLEQCPQDCHPSMY